MVQRALYKRSEKVEGQGLGERSRALANADLVSISPPLLSGCHVEIAFARAWASARDWVEAWRASEARGIMCDGPDTGVERCVAESSELRRAGTWALCCT
eukprot:1635730-Rhodomonas_salina.1